MGRGIALTMARAGISTLLFDLNPQALALAKQEHEKEFHCVFTEVASTNIRSLQAHLSIGFKIQKTYEQEKIIWHIMIWDWT